MGYYGMGDYYAMGDPGLFSGIGKVLGKVGKVVGKVAGVASNFIPGGGLLRTAAKVIGKVSQGAGIAAAGAAIAQRTGMLGPSPGMLPAFPSQSPMAAAMPMASGQCEPGFHLNKSRVTFQGQVLREARTVCVKNRSMNPANAKGLRRAVRREKAFIGLARAALRGTGISIGRKSFAKKTGRRR